jgi:three-Cys-motif partner protein
MQLLKWSGSPLLSPQQSEMSDSLPTVWPADPHTFAKHAILKRFLEAWFPILSRQAATLATSPRKILYVDGFAGPGEYEGREPGSPVIALNVALNTRLPTPVHFVFVEHRPDRHAHLTQIIDRERSRIGASTNVVVETPYLGSCDEVLPAILNDYDRRGIEFGPALAFLDQFGYSAVSMNLIGRIMRYRQCEVFSYLDYKDMNRWISDPDKQSAFTRAYGGEEWRDAVPLPEARRRAMLLDRYKAALRSRAKVQYVQSFSMFDQAGALLYWLLFCTNHLKGLEEMKKAMWKVDGSGGFRFSDRDDPDQLQLLDQAFGQDWLADTLAVELDSQSLSIEEVQAFVLTRTPCYLFKAALNKLLARRQLSVVSRPPGSKSGFADEKIVVRFERNSLF